MIKLLLFLVLPFSVLADTITLAWDPSSSAQWITSYKLYEKTGDQTELIYKLSVPSTQTTVTFEIKPAQRYSWHVTAATDSLESDPSNEISYTIEPTLLVSSYLDGPSRVVVLESSVFTGMNYEILASRDFTVWESVATGITTSDQLRIPFNPTDPWLFFKLKKAIPSTIRAASRFSSIEPLSFKPASRWSKLKHTLRYRPGMHPKDRFSNQKPVVREFKLPPMPGKLRME